MSSDLATRLRTSFENHTPRRVHMPDARAAAVLIPIYGGPQATLILTVRSENLPSHKGQISFPGGSIDPEDASPVAAALREANEEIGLAPDAVEVMGQLDDMPTFVSGYVVTPVVGYLNERPKLTRNPAEVTKILEVPATDLVDEIRREPGFSDRGRSYPTEAWVWRDHVIWGVTARLLRDLLTHLAEVGITEAPGRTESWTGWPPPAATA